ncbi:hypothetical protein D5F01_LYC23847 [Larimichthys crocea]|uniref:Uncharacterized protein n=1 Tax=Larimichthys crocea TaxID=215358 RepID=A0A6G0HGD4_LARCR|nr:hypothetical protein D5F01_LYC23847 [Larimichthys crocea]
MSDSEDLELEEALQGADELLQDMEHGPDVKHLVMSPVSTQEQITRTLKDLEESLNVSKNGLGVDDDTLELWVADVQKWAEVAADLKTKREVFEKVMAVRRLKEEEMILCREMHRHWTALKARALELGTISSDSSLVGMSEDADAKKGLHCLLLKKQTELKAEMVKVKDYYQRILSHQPLLETGEEEEENSDDAAESDFSTSDED